ncbi:hypothetical protein PsorP6_009127 [Peronosclerospora sorghi]|uniref:Uncharacterized protein n=1 Tax=Peronosclerospora sorghi TaxID=230839 RepID=A0ACC0VX50_9STRA|nr:hypothetical protein PsorP6_009127 [Peronosclerospora sorghi]
MKDSTNKCETLSEDVAHGIMHFNVMSSTPVIYGVLSCESGSQDHSCAEKRSCGGIEEDHNGEKTDKATCPSSEHTTTKEEGIKVTPSKPMKHEESSSSGSIAHGKCGKCGSPGDSSKCGLLH